MKNMKKLVILFLSLFLGMNSVFAYNLILPKEKKTVTTNQYAFFVGKAQNTEIITINDKRIFTASNGAFAHSVK